MATGSSSVERPEVTAVRLVNSPLGQKLFNLYTNTTNLSQGSFLDSVITNEHGMRCSRTEKYCREHFPDVKIVSIIDFYEI